MPSHHSAIILAGGAGTRLQPIVGALPKCLAPVNGKPFLHYLLQQLAAQGFRQVILALGVGANEVTDYAHQWQEDNGGLAIEYSVEDTPLGTGGAILKAMPMATSNWVLVINGDTYLDVSFAQYLDGREPDNIACKMLLVQMQDASRYGTVTLDDEGCITAFREKQAGSAGLINAGCYWVRNNALLPQQKFLPTHFSWEKDMLPAACRQHSVLGAATQGYFIDIGVPADYEKAQQDFKILFPMLQPASDWTLFLDRDGVINIEKENDYIHTWEEFVFYDDAIASIAAFSRLFARIIIVTNQKGVGKGLTKPANLATIHRNMVEAITRAGGRIDAIYFCPDLDDNSPNRKPNPGMALQAKADHPEIDFAKSVIVGNNASDMHFGRNAGMHTVFLRSTHPDLVLPDGLADMEAASLSHLVKAWSRHPV